jgi:ubiquinone biosynthesis protein COQ9
MTEIWLGACWISTHSAMLLPKGRYSYLKKKYNMKEQLFRDFLELVPLHGWNQNVIHILSLSYHQQPGLIELYYPNGLLDFEFQLHNQIDQQWTADCQTLAVANLPIRERIFSLIMKRFDYYEPLKDVLQPLHIYYAKPHHLMQSTKRLWNLADQIWYLAQDQSTDWNYYSKRLLLSGIISSSMLFWLYHDQPNTTRHDTEAFVRRRIEEVLTLGRTLKRPLSSFIPFLRHVVNDK